MCIRDRESILHANQVVLTEKMKKPELDGMGTTMITVGINDNVLSWAMCIVFWQQKAGNRISFC